MAIGDPWPIPCALRAAKSDGFGDGSLFPGRLTTTDLFSEWTGVIKGVQLTDVLMWLVVSNIFFFPYIGNNHPNWLYFSEGLKPPTSDVLGHFDQFRLLLAVGCWTGRWIDTRLNSDGFSAGQTLQLDKLSWVLKVYVVPSGKHTKNYGKSPCY